ncbi:uncharacterized protein [Antedon mediterranea]|uniref:uncharacterized protein isoform X1 n=1 Tax=Antedon mediterranea TaxID=105859 RepID=UPI003AF4D4B4
MFRLSVILFMFLYVTVELSSAANPCDYGDVEDGNVKCINPCDEGDKCLEFSNTECMFIYSISSIGCQSIRRRSDGGDPCEGDPCGQHRCLSEDGFYICIESIGTNPCDNSACGDDMCLFEDGKVKCINQCEECLEFSDTECMFIDSTLRCKSIRRSDSGDPCKKDDPDDNPCGRHRCISEDGFYICFESFGTSLFAGMQDHNRANG